MVDLVAVPLAYFPAVEGGSLAEAVVDILAVGMVVEASVVAGLAAAGMVVAGMAAAETAAAAEIAPVGIVEHWEEMAADWVVVPLGSRS
jgi:hypothetical protein